MAVEEAEAAVVEASEEEEVEVVEEEDSRIMVLQRKWCLLGISPIRVRRILW